MRQHEATIARLHRTRFAEVEEAHVTQRHAEVALTRIGALTLPNPNRSPNPIPSPNQVARVGSAHTLASLRAELVGSRP